MVLCIELELNQKTFYAGDQILLEISFKNNVQGLEILDGSVQLIGKSLFVSNYYSFSRVKEYFGEMSKIKDENKIILTEKGQVFTFPFYLTKPALFLSNDFKPVQWRGRLPIDLPASLIGIFYSFQHFVKVKIVWKSKITNEINFTEEELVFVVLNHKPCESNILGLLNDVTIYDKNKLLFELFPDDLLAERVPVDIIDEIKRIKSYDDNVKCDKNEIIDYIRYLVEADKGYHRSVSIEDNGPSSLDNNSNPFATLHILKTTIRPGTQIFVTIDLFKINRIELITLRLVCTEIYPKEFLKLNSEENVWQEVVKELKVIPGNRDKIEIVFPVPPELSPSISGPFVTLKWELLTIFLIEKQEFNLNIPLKFISFNLKLDKNGIK